MYPSLTTVWILSQRPYIFPKDNSSSPTARYHNRQLILINGTISYPSINPYPTVMYPYPQVDGIISFPKYLSLHNGTISKRSNSTYEYPTVLLCIVTLNLTERALVQREKKKRKKEKRRENRLRTYNFGFLGKNEDGVQKQDTREKTKAEIMNENESTVEVEHQH